jgi:hypothetical protein
MGTRPIERCTAGVACLPGGAHRGMVQPQACLCCRYSPDKYAILKQQAIRLPKLQNYFGDGPIKW